MSLSEREDCGLTARANVFAGRNDVRHYGVIKPFEVDVRGLLSNGEHPNLDCAHKDHNPDESPRLNIGDVSRALWEAGTRSSLRSETKPERTYPEYCARS